MKSLGLLSGFLLVVGCATQRASDGPVTVVLAPREDVVTTCSTLVGRPAAGCLVRNAPAVLVVCPHNDARCLAHEIRHIIEGSFHR